MSVDPGLLARAHARAEHLSPRVVPPHDDRDRRISRTRLVGTGRPAFERVATALLAMEIHRRAGVAVTPDGDVTPGATVVLGIGLRRLAVVAPCWVRTVRRDTSSAGFVYDALDGHPVIGWEHFTVAIVNDAVTFSVEAESRPAWPLPRPTRPLQNLVQDTIIRRYLRAAERVSRDLPLRSG
ncbi:DUF1990 family protein [Pseudonocardia phyllosphaerae]|uniref:DUF1990 family protein n=1 Tax=Pseudonocardia phyllosphaerae TaxID=3390502 RepID=UPI00397B437B